MENIADYTKPNIQYMKGGKENNKREEWGKKNLYCREENSFTVGKKKERISETGRKKKGENYEKGGGRDSQRRKCHGRNEL